MSVTELTREQLIELKQDYLVELDAEGIKDKVIYGEDTGEHGVACSEFANADELVPDSMVFEHYAGTIFVEEDFSC